VTAVAPASEADYAGDAFERTPPHDLPAERAVLGGMMISQAAIGDVLGVLALGSGEFYRPAHQLVYEAILALYGAGKPTNVVAVAAELTRAGNIGRMGGHPYLHTIIEETPAGVMAAYHARTVRDRAILRRVVEVGQRAVEAAYSAAGDAEDLAVVSAQEMEGVLAGLAGDPLLPMSALMPGVLDLIETPPAPGSRIPTGFADLDALMGGGVRAGQFVIVAARPALGKSTLALDIARYAASDHRRHEAVDVLFFSLEMPRDEVMMRALSAEARVPLAAIREGGAAVSDADWGRLRFAGERMMEFKLHVDDAPIVGSSQVKARFMELARAGTRPRMIIIDYMQLMATPGRKENRQQEVSDLSRSLKLLAKELGVPIIALSQLNRGPEQRTDKRPMLSDLRESGSLEQDSDMVILLHREDAYERDSPRAGEADLIVAKHRNGATSTITVAFQGHYARFVDMAPVDSNERHARDRTPPAPGYVSNAG
jgi:replicative DNA helicase